MTLDAGIHHVGTEPSHMIPIIVSLPVAILMDWGWLLWMVSGASLVLVWSNMRCQAPDYRWRLREPGPAKNNSED